MFARAGRKIADIPCEISEVILVCKDLLASTMCQILKQVPQGALRAQSNGARRRINCRSEIHLEDELEGCDHGH